VIPFDKQVWKFIQVRPLVKIACPGYPLNGFSAGGGIFEVKKNIG
jgi:hypothetical protein